MNPSNGAKRQDTKRLEPGKYEVVLIKTKYSLRAVKKAERKEQTRVKYLSKNNDPSSVDASTVVLHHGQSSKA